MKMKKFSLTLVCLLAVTGMRLSAASLTQTVASINSDAQKAGGPAKVLQSVSKSTGVPVATLEKQKTTTGLTYGDIFAAHTVAKASGKTFDEIVALRKKGDSWDKISTDTGVAPSGSKKTAAQPTPKPSPTAPKRTLADEMKDRWK